MIAVDQPRALHKDISALWATAHGIGLVAAFILITGSARLTICLDEHPGAGNHGPFAYDRGNAYVIPALALTGLYIVVATAVFAWSTGLNTRQRPTPNLSVAYLLGLINWANAGLQDDSPFMCDVGSTLIGLAVLLAPHLMIVGWHFRRSLQPRRSTDEPQIERDEQPADKL